jgi:hypothetical protein
MAQIVVMHDIVEGPKVHHRPAITKLQRLLPVRRSGCLLQEQEQLGDAGLARTVRAKEDGEGRQTDLSRVLPGFEILEG